jgi:hypothetical protein
MRRGFGFLWVALTSILLVGVGVIAYQAGWSEGAATHVVNGVTTTVPYYYDGPHFFGFGFFGFLFFLFLLFVLFRIARFGRGWGRGGWGHRGWGPGGYYGGQGGGVPPAIDEKMQEWHKRAHGEQTAPVPPPPDQKQA